MAGRKTIDYSTLIPVILIVIQPWLACLAMMYLSRDAFLVVSLGSVIGTCAYIWSMVTRKIKSAKEHIADTVRNKNSTLDYVNTGMKLWQIIIGDLSPLRSRAARQDPPPSLAKNPVAQMVATVGRVFMADSTTPVASSVCPVGQTGPTGPTWPTDGSVTGVSGPAGPVNVPVTGVSGPAGPIPSAVHSSSCSCHSHRQ